MDSIIRVLCGVNHVTAANPSACCDSIESILQRAPKADIAIFPSLSLCSPSCGSLFSQYTLVEECEKALERIIKLSYNYGGYLIVGCPYNDCGNIVAVNAVICDGKLLGLIPDYGDYNGLSKNFSDELMPRDTMFACGNLRFCVGGGDGDNLITEAFTAYTSGANLFIHPSFSAVRAGSLAKIHSAAKAVSQQFSMAIAVVNGGAGSTSSPYAYKGMISVCENGQTLVSQQNDFSEFFACVDIDWEILKSKERVCGTMSAVHNTLPIQKYNLMRTICQNPYIAIDGDGAQGFLHELFDLQVNSLAARLENARINSAILGISGGLDSTLALMVAVEAFNRLSLPITNLICVTMPGFGTSDRTYYNALGLIEAMGVKKMEVPIGNAVMQHFGDIGHDPALKDVTYENAQARERTQILFDIANKTGAVVIGTGDLSEAALGWCTFGGDALAGYNVNICIPKTMIRLIIKHLAEESVIENAKEYLLDVLSTPVSPELLPAHDNGEISQKTEDILGPYDLHDFFIYYHVKYGFDTKKLYAYANAAFGEVFDPMEIKRCLGIFLKRFYFSQFKRNCAPESAAITEVNLNGVCWNMPADLGFSYMQRQLEEI